MAEPVDQSVRASGWHLWRAIRALPWRFIAIYTAGGLLFSFTSFGRNPEPGAWFPDVLVWWFWPGLMVHEGAHFGAGVLVALPLRSRNLALASGLLGLLIDVDHIGWMAGLAMYGRVGHSIGFIVAILALTWVLPRWAFRDTPPGSRLYLGAIAAASVPAHAAVEALTPYRDVYPWAPVSFEPLILSPWHAVPLLLASAGLVWVVRLAGTRGTQSV